MLLRNSNVQVLTSTTILAKIFPSTPNNIATNTHVSHHTLPLLSNGLKSMSSLLHLGTDLNTVGPLNEFGKLVKVEVSVRV